ncbi:hypothetical protein, partial [Microbacterium ginsengisoli]|uniref:hypothetical protein n=1 Tax=Microbacterium ginsengisoli TaxID=400772 RepID=UPI001B801E7A
MSEAMAPRPVPASPRATIASTSSCPDHCGVCRSLAVFCDRFVSLIADDEDAGGGFDDVVGDGVELVDLE